MTTTDFKIRRGPSTTLFPTPGVVNPRLVIEAGCWYLCTDTADLFLGVLTENDGLVLKRINGEHISATDTPTHTPSTSPDGGEPNDNLAELEYAVGVLQDEIANIKDGIVDRIKIGDAVYIRSEGAIELPEFATETFVLETIAAATTDIDHSLFATKEDLVGLASESYVDEKIAAIELPKFPSTLILFGGDATPDND